MELDSWVDTAIYEFIQKIRVCYKNYYDFMARFRVTGGKRFFIDLASDALSFIMIGGIVATLLAQDAFQITKDGEWNRPFEYSVVFLDRFGNEMGRRGPRANANFELDDLPNNLINATLATEDRRFFYHWGIDVWGTLRALVANYRAGSVVQGGSTITQQLAKDVFLSPERSLSRKINEAFLSFWLEANYTKQEILELYLGRAYLGGGNFGVVAASEHYFGKPVAELTLAESAMLAGLFKAPSKSNPNTDLGAARARANDVLYNLVEAGFLTLGQIANALRRPAHPVAKQNTTELANYFLDWAYEELKREVDGLTNQTTFIARTTFDPILQAYADQSIRGAVKDQGQNFGVSQGAMSVLEPDGAVRALVGGIDYGKSQFNRATVTTRQPGSTFKPIVYTALLEQGLTPDSRLKDYHQCYNRWCPRNYSGRSFGDVSMRQALARSINRIPVHETSSRIGTENLANWANKLGIRSEVRTNLSAAIGSEGTSTLDLASVYAVFANGGFKATPYGITRVTTLSGDVIVDKAQRKAPPERIIKERVAFNMNSMLRSVVTSGTGRRAEMEEVPTAGKTGTTSSYRDAWFAGYTGNYVATVWFGNDNYDTTNRLTGGRLPAQTWRHFMELAHDGITPKPIPGVNFAIPDHRVILAQPAADIPLAITDAPQSLSRRTSVQLSALTNDLTNARRSRFAGTLKVPIIQAGNNISSFADPAGQQAGATNRVTIALPPILRSLENN